MTLGQDIIEILKYHSSEMKTADTRLLKRKEIVDLLLKEYPDSYGMKVVKGSETHKTVEVRVEASVEGMKLWLLSHCEKAEVLNPCKELKEGLRDAVAVLNEKYGFLR